MIELTLPWPPSVNHYKKVGKLIKTKTGKMYQQRVNTNETKMFYWNVYQEVKKRMPKEGSIFRRSETIGVELYIEMSPPSERRWDVDNRLKVLLDSLVRAMVLADDSQIQKLIVLKMPMIANGKILLRISEYDKEASIKVSL